MKAIVIKQYGGPEVLAVEERPMPEAKMEQILIEVKAFGINHAEIYFRQGAWGDVAEISGIECVGVVKADPSGQFQAGQKVIAIVDGMGRSINGSYAEYTVVPASNVAPVSTDLSWEELAAIPESYATAWSCLHGNLALKPGQTVLIRGATSALGQAAINIAAHLGAHVITTTRNAERVTGLEVIGAKEVLIETPGLQLRVYESCRTGSDRQYHSAGFTCHGLPGWPRLPGWLSRWRWSDYQPGACISDPQRASFQCVCQCTGNR
jgi:NADPH:quinone reductase-like Zn-dependent oxidoreductase